MGGELGHLVARLRPRFGIHAVRGNVESDRWREQIFGGTEVATYEATTTVQVGPVYLTALSFGDSFDPRLHVPRRPGPHVVFGHGPDFSLGHVEADLAVAGHTHGGQVQLPFFGPLVTFSRVPRTVGAGGRFTLPTGTTLVVSRGIGMERGAAPRLRFLCPPEIVVIDLVPAARPGGHG